MNTQPLVSILMNCYNSEEFLANAVESVLAQSYQNWELIFIDNQSTDHSAQIIHSYKDDRIKYYRTPQFMTLYSARAYGQNFISGKYLGFLDCDDNWTKEKLKIQVEYMEEKNILFLHSSFKVRYEVMATYKAYLLAIYHHIKQRFLKSQISNVAEQLMHYNINLQTVLLRADKIQDIKFRPEYNLFGDLVFFVEHAKKNSTLFFKTKRFLAMTRIHPKQLSRQSSENWLLEAIACEKNVFANLLDNEEKKAFEVLKQFYASENYLFQKDLHNALALKNNIKFFHFVYFINYWKTRLVKFK